MERHCCAFLLRLDVGSVCIGQAVRISSGVYPDYRFFMKRRGASAAFLPFKNTLDKLSIAYIMYIYNLMGDDVEILISNSSGVPIYEQITRQIKGLIARGELREGEALPSMRLLAKELRISVITTKRAYEELEREGYIETVMGKGSFVTPRNLELAREDTLRRVEEKLGEALEIARQGGIAFEELVEILTILHGDE